MNIKVFDPNQKAAGRIENAFPLPPARSDMCRDAFLKELLVDYKSTEVSESSLELLPHQRPVKHLKFEDLFDDELLTTDEVLLKEYLLGIGIDRRYSYRNTTTSTLRGSRIIAPDILKIMRGRKMSIYTALGFVGVLFQLAQLKNKLRVLRELWKVDVSLDKSFRIFSWCHSDYYNRFALRNPTYLDVTERELGDQIECYKFNIDIREISRLVDALEDDFRHKRNICDSSMLLLNEAKLDIVQVLMETRKKVEEVHANTVLEVCRLPRSADPDQSIRYAVNKKIEINDFIYPIEARYRIKWAETQLEQHKNWNDRGYNKMLEEITFLHTTTIESSFIWQSSGAAYEMQIAGLKKRIANLEEEFEHRIALVDAEKKVIQNKVHQAVEDLKKYKDAIPFFHKRIAEVNAILYPPVVEEPEPEPEPVKIKKKGKKK